VTSPRLLQAHRYVALGLGVIVLLLTCSGAALVFRDELTAFFTPQVVIAPRDIPADAHQRMLAAARSVDPEARTVEIVPAVRPNRAYEVILKGARGERHLFVDPHDARIVADNDRQSMPFVTLFILHRQFFLGGGGDYLAAAGGFALFFLAASGIVLWWPRAWKYALRLRLGGGRQAVSYDLHRAIGAIFATFLLINAATGVSMVFDEALPRAVNAAAGMETPPELPAASPGKMRPLDDIVAAANRALPDGHVARVVVREGKLVMVRKRLAGENDTKGMNRIYVDGATGTVVAARALDRQPPGGRIYEWIYPLHTGKLVGWPYQAVLLLAGLAPLVSAASGLILWRSRSKRKNPSGAMARAPVANGVR
jgi:uncharacterized iron-regulated membrane protein